MLQARLERAAYCLEGSCSIQLSYWSNVGTARLERAASASQTQRSSHLSYVPMYSLFYQTCEFYFESDHLL